MNRKKINIIICTAISIAAICLLAAGMYRMNSIGYDYKDKIMGIYILDKGEKENLKKKTASGKRENIGIYFEDYLLPYDSKSNCFYLTQTTLEKDWKGICRLGESLKKDGYLLCGIEDEYWYQKNKAISKNHKFELWIINEKECLPVNLVVSGMPILSITTTHEDKEATEKKKQQVPVELTELYNVDETVYYGQATIFDPDKSGDYFRIVNCGINYHIKGGSSKYFPKKSYDIELLDDNNEPWNQSLLGMRKDDDWKLNAMYADEFRIREKTASQIWEQMDMADGKTDQEGPRMEYVEVIIDNNYQGLYALVEPVDTKKCGMKEEDILYKISDWYIPTKPEIQTAIINKWNILETIKISHPKEIGNYKEVWKPMREYLSQFYYGEYDYETAKNIIDIHNLADYHIFLQVISGADNDWKNIYYCAYVEEDGSFQMKLRPWDLDYTFGNNYKYIVDDENDEDEGILSDNYKGVFAEVAIYRLRESNIDEVSAVFLERWYEYRKDILTTNKILGLFEQNATYLQETGAILREAGRWPESNVNKDISSLKKYQHSRMKWLEQWVLEWKPEHEKGTE